MQHIQVFNTRSLFPRIFILLTALLFILMASLQLHAQQEDSAESIRKETVKDDVEKGAAAGDGTEAVNEAPAESDDAAVPAELPDYEYEDPEFNENRISYPMMILRTVAVMGVIIIGVYFLFRTLVKKKSKLVANSEVITVLATYPLAANRIIQVVDIGGQVLVLGVSESSINLITELKDKESIDQIRLASSKEQGGAGTFKETFMNLLGGKGFSKPGQISHLSGYQKRINRMRKM